MFDNGTTDFLPFRNRSDTEKAELNKQLVIIEKILEYGASHYGDVRDIAISIWEVFLLLLDIKPCHLYSK